MQPPSKAIQQCPLGSGPDVVSRGSRDIEIYARYEALLDLSSKARACSSIADLACCISANWRYCANVLTWRLIVRGEDELHVIDFDGGETRISNPAMEALAVAEREFLNRNIPRRLRQNDIDVLLPKLSGHLVTGSVREIIVLPMNSGGRGLQVLAIIGVGPSPASPIDLKFIEAVGNILSGELSYIITASRLTQALEQQANQDALTGIPNRRNFETRLDLHWRDSMRKHEPISLLMIDIDNFKRYNDHYGHLAGDNCLRTVARALSAAVLRPMDFCARYGGEEFVVILPNTPLLGAGVIGRRLIAAIRNLAIEHVANGDRKTASISIGASAIVPTASNSCRDLLAAADKALYLAKNSGRDKLCELAA